MSFLSNILALLPDNISKRIKPVDLRNSFEYVYADMAKLQEDRILTLGSITATTTTIDLAVHSSGVNSVQIDGEVLAKSTADHWEFAEVTAEEVFIIYATNSTEIFQLAENGMEIPADALIVATITISETGTSIDEAVSGFREKAIDKWANLMASGGDMVLSLHHNQMRYRVSSSANDVRIGGFKNYVTDLLYSGIPLSIKNNTEGDIEFFNAEDASPLFIPIYSADLPFKIKKGETANFAWNTDNGFEIVKTGGGASFPELGNNGDVLVKYSASVDDAVWSDRLTTAENNILNKVDKPPSDGTWSLQKLGSVFTWVSGVVQNIANTDLSNISARIFTQGNTFTWNTAGFFYYLKGLLDKTGNPAYTKVVVVHPTTGEMVTRDFADPQATTLAVQNASTSQKTAMRVALLGTAVPASPIINVVNTFFIKKEVYTSLFLNGINLTPLEPTSIWIESGATKIYAENYYAISGTVLQTFWNIPASFPNGEYSVKIANGAVTQGASPGKIYVTDTITNININSLNTTLKVRDGYTLVENTSAVFENIIRIFKYSTTYPTVNDSSIDVAIKTPNFSTPGSSWEIQIDFFWILWSGHAETSIMNPLVLLTETSDVNFTSVESIVQNYKLIESGARLIRSAINTGFIYGIASSFSFNIKKTGNIINIYRINTSTGTIDLFQTLNIDDSKTYALAFFGTRNTQADTLNHRMQFNFTKFYFKP